MDRNKHFFFWVFTISLLIILIVPTLIQDGMFMDGMLYACVSKNLSHGIGSFWFPHYSSTLYPFFDQQPPLGFGIQSMFFKVFGDGMYVERFYSFLCAIITTILISRLWKLLFKNESEMKGLSWLPVIFWITIPVCFWSYSNNLLENTMCIFDLLAIIYILKYILQRQRLYYILVAGFFVFLATFTKGIQGSFPIAALFFGWIIYRKFSFSKMFLNSLLLLFVPSIIYFLLLQDPSAYESMSTYLNHRVLNSIQNVSEVESRFFLLGRLISELIPAILLTAFFIVPTFLKAKGSDESFRVKYKEHSLFLLLVGISASFPLMVTLEQRSFYLTTSFPYFAMCLAVIAAPGIILLMERINSSSITKALKIFSVLFFAASIAFSFSKTGKISRDETMLHDTYLIGNTIPKGTVLGSTDELWRDWPLQEYLVRDFYICLDDTILPENKFILIASEESILPELEFRKVNIPTKKYHLYRKP